MESPELSQLVERAADLVTGAQRLVVFTGAGVSTESGIPDFRSRGGLWERHQPITYQEFLDSVDARARAWRLHRDLYATVKAAQPNPTHVSLAELDRLGKLDCVITQNVDFLHQRAGLPDHRVIELHGTLRWVACLSCCRRYARDDVQRRLEGGEVVPACEACGGILKPTTVSFGQPMPPEETAEAIRRSRAADVFMVLGSSLVVYPAARLPVMAAEAGARLILINLTPTPLDSYAEVAITAPTGEIMPRIVARVRGQSL